jgi:hypothetical protein
VIQFKNKIMSTEDLVLPEKDKVEYLVGDPSNILQSRVLHPLNDLTIEFLSELSNIILKSPIAKLYPDVITFGYWCRAANLKKMKAGYTNLDVRKGLGTVFHIAPSNVPINFAFSYVFSLLSGNVSIVRVPSKQFEQIDIVSSMITSLFDNPKYNLIKNNTYFIRYPQNVTITQQLSAISNARLIWGSDVTVKTIKSFDTPSKCLDIPFSERYSFAVIGAAEVLNLDEVKLKRLVDGFFNDTYLMDQNACSSPQFILWYTKDDQITEAAKVKFWNAVNRKVSNEYDLAAKSSVDKLTWMCLDLVNRDFVTEIHTNTNNIYRVQINTLPDSILELNGKYGYFYEYSTSDLSIIEKFMDIKIQTLTYFGVNKEELFNVVYSAGNVGIDRIVPIGTALDIGMIWDGYDMMYTLSKIIDLK